jgi:hypothetical protein
MDAAAFYNKFPRLYHMAHHEALPGIQKRGLLSTTALLDLFEIKGEERSRIETQMRRESVVIEHRMHGRAVIRDQKPIQSDKRLAQALGTSATPAEWHRLLNSKVFFWVDEDRLNTLRRARAYRHQPQLILILDTKRVVEAAQERIWLCDMNSGCCVPYPHPRSPERFRRLADAEGKVVECAIDTELSPVESLLISATVVPPLA